MSSATGTNVWAMSSSPPVVQVNSQDTMLSDDDSDIGEFVYPSGTYSSQMQELFDDDASENNGPNQDLNPEDEEEEFTYTGMDVSNESFTYQEQLREVLDLDHSEEETEEVEKSLTQVDEFDEEDEPLQHDDHVFLPESPSASSTSRLSPPSRNSTPERRGSYLKLARPYLHPTVSRLRSYTPSPQANTDESAETRHSHLFAGSPVPSRFSSISRVSSTSNLQTTSSEQPEPRDSAPALEQEVFRWTDLQSITQTIFSKASQKASSLLGTPVIGSPTTLAANGLICIGTTEGKIVLYDFKQTLVCVCESNIGVSQLGPVTALAMSHDHTFVVSGHSTGYILLYNLKTPRSPVRTVPPTTLNAVLSGRKEGHLVGSRIISIGFVAGRHTGLVSADDKGLAFFHSLGKVLFIDATDILRILGKYPDPPSIHGAPKSPLASSVPQSGSLNKRKHFTVLGMAPLPLGTVPHPTDLYHVIGLLTPTKLVVVGLKPAPRTWFKCPREIDEGGPWMSKSKWIGNLAWFPSVSPTGTATNLTQGPPSAEAPTQPRLAYSWGKSLHVITIYESRTKQLVKNSKTGKTAEIDVGVINYRPFTKWSANDDIIALQWLNFQQIIVVTETRLGVLDLSSATLIEEVSFDGLSLISPWVGERPTDVDHDRVQHSIRVYKGKVFLLRRDRLSAGTLLTWADRILTSVQQGNFLEAIELTRRYYVDEAPGNRNNLPDDKVERKQIIGDRLRSLMEASAQYAFSDDRMTDHTHITPDNRGVDRTSLFEDLVKACCKASIALDDTEFLFEDLFQKYEDSGISSIYLRQLEPFVLNNGIRYVPPRITQQLITLHAQDERGDLVERIIWHIDPSCLDLNQTILLCQHHQLYDALVYIYTRALRDYVAPIVELLGLIRRIQQYRRSQLSSPASGSRELESNSSIESTILNAYKVYPYLANTLSSLTYPSEEPLPEDEALQAKNDIYAFLFFGRSSIWPPGKDGKLVLTADEEGGVEPTYPYARQLLNFDSESFLHSLDIAFEDAYLNEESQSISRLMIVRILMEIILDGSLALEDVTFVNIFIARNVPKYPQFLFEQLAPSALHNILVGLAQDPDTDSKEDRQLAAEYLLSVYSPHDTGAIVSLFEEAGFYRILRTWYHQERKWAQLLSAYVDDPDVTSVTLLDSITEIVSSSIRANKGVIPSDLSDVIDESLPRLLDADIVGTAIFVDKFTPILHQDALSALGSSQDSDEARFIYLRTLLRPQLNDDTYIHPHISTPSPHVSKELRKTFLDLHAQFHPDTLIQTLQTLPDDTFDQFDILTICESRGVYDAVVWAINWQGEPQRALTKADTFQKQLCKSIIEKASEPITLLSTEEELHSLRTIARVARQICLDRSQSSSTIEVPLEDIWFQLLCSQISNVQIISSLMSDMTNDSPSDSTLDGLLSSLRDLVQTTFGSLVSITSTSAVSFPRLFKRLVNSTPSSSGSHYTEFRIILTGMLESYRSDEDLLIMLKHLVERDLFETTAEVSRERAHGWALSRGTCQFCHLPLLVSSKGKGKSAAEDEGEPPRQIVVSRSGDVYHLSCKTST